MQERKGFVFIARPKAGLFARGSILTVENVGVAEENKPLVHR